MNDVPEPRPAGPPSARGLWALGFVAVALVALVAVPATYGQRVDVVQSRIGDVLEPAARLSSSLRLLKARQFARVEGFLLTGDRGFRAPYIAAIAEEDSVVARLRELARDLDLEVFERLARYTSESTEWNFANQRLFEAGVEPEADDRVREGYLELERSILELDRAIQAQVREGRREVAVARARQTQSSVGLALVALLATLIVGRVAYRYRELTIERERGRREAVRARREVDAVLEATGDGVLGIDLDGLCTSLNRAGSALLGYTEGEITGRNVHETLFHSTRSGEALSRADSQVLTAVAEGRPLDSEDGAVLWRRKRVSFPARWSLRPLIDGLELRGAVLTFTDMTEIHEKEEALHRAVRQREDVVSIVSHDLRNPLGVALAAADLLLDIPLDEDQRRRQLEIVVRSGKRMQALIEDLLDVSRIEAGGFVVRPSSEELGPILEEARALFAEQAAAKAVRLGVEAEFVEARVDRDRIMQALTNLIENALRVVVEGGWVMLRAEEAGSEVRITVSDDGPGIAAERLPHLFDRFTQGEGEGVVGLGLTIVRGVATAHGGDVTVQSAVGEGTSFTLVLPKAGPPVGERGNTQG